MEKEQIKKILEPLGFCFFSQEIDKEEITYKFKKDNLHFTSQQVNPELFEGDLVLEFFLTILFKNQAFYLAILELHNPKGNFLVDIGSYTDIGILLKDLKPPSLLASHS